ncbi:growth-regulating factor 12-like isoform X2 [Phalaenopsis equestris]|uniref:growth-regulating factor 12-like isoform X2 n=1 Tax=Phalaenopsis equestris TaxID=78828 RepID=UPI0009E366D8|nr:growth-regulating factor 12-like isoform X2 [Phalaenopsis equestris]
MATKEHTSSLNDHPFSPPPSKIARLSSHSPTSAQSRLCFPCEKSVTAASPSPLTLGLNGSSVPSPVKKPIFTFMQMQELEHQALIYKYMEGGLPVPLHLVLPIWKSVVAANCVSGCGGLCLDYRNSLEPEPGRCRRTDGKKWRCSRDVVQNQKYCERHMHRGRVRSRKTMEAEGSSRGGGGDGFDEFVIPAVP